jgi:hypothetical protein
MDGIQAGLDVDLPLEPDTEAPLEAWQAFVYQQEPTVELPVAPVVAPVEAHDIGHVAVPVLTLVPPLQSIA